MAPKTVLKQRAWTDTELRKAGFKYYDRRKQLVMARPLLATESPLLIKTAFDSLVVKPGYIICYDPGESVQMTLYSYPHWPVRPDVFAETYREWDEPDWKPTPPQSHLMKLSCKPYYKFRGIWAQQVTKPTTVQSLESHEPVLAPVGCWIAIGIHGEPWTMSADTLQQRYVISQERQG